MNHDEVHRQRQSYAEHKGPPSMTQAEAEAARRRELEIGTRACLLWAEAALRWERLGYRLRDVPADIIVATWRECCEQAEREIDAKPAHGSRWEDSESDRYYQTERERDGGAR